MISIASMRYSGKTARRISAFMLVAVTVVLFLQFNRYLMHAIFPWTRYSYHSDSMEPIDVVLGRNERLHLRIPGAYLASLPEDDQGISSTVQLEAYLPDMLPKKIYYEQHPTIATRDLDAIAELRRSWLFLTINATDPADRKYFFELMSFYKQSFTLRQPDENSAYEIYDYFPAFDEHGNKHMYDMARETVYFPKLSHEYYIVCLGTNTDFDSCMLNFIHENKIRVNVGMKPDNLSRPDYIRKTVSDLLHRLTTSR